MVKPNIVYARIFVSLASLIGLSACSDETNTPASQQTNLPMFVTATAIGIIPTPLSSPTSLLVRASISPAQDEVAPPYEEIRATTLALRGDPKLLITPEEIKQLALYRDSLVGKKFEGWVGWTTSITPPREYAEANQNSFDMGVLMKEPGTDPKRKYREVILYEVTREQAEHFDAWTFDPELYGVNKVVFSGTIFYVHDLTVEAYVSEVTPIK